MNRRPKRTALICAFVICVVLLLLWIFRVREPWFDGHSLSYWLKLNSNSMANDPSCQTSKEAIQAIGTNALPWLLKWATKRDSAARKVTTKWLNVHLPARFHLTTQDERATEASAGFASLGKDAQALWPVFVSWSLGNDARLRSVGLQYLQSTRADEGTMVPLMRQLLTNSDKNVQLAAVFYFVDQCPQKAEEVGVFKLFPEYIKRSVLTIDTKPANH